MGQQASAGVTESRLQAMLCSRCHEWGGVQGGLVIVLGAVALWYILHLPTGPLCISAHRQVAACRLGSNIRRECAAVLPGLIHLVHSFDSFCVPDLQAPAVQIVSAQKLDHGAHCGLQEAAGACCL